MGADALSEKTSRKTGYLADPERVKRLRDGNFATHPITGELYQWVSKKDLYFRVD